MRTIQSKLILTSLAVILFCFMSFSFKSSQPPTKYLTLRTIEVINGMWDSKIVIVYEDGKIEEIELEKFRSKNFSDNTKKIHDAVDYVAAKGYTLVSASTGNGDACIIATYIFTKN